MPEPPPDSPSTAAMPVFYDARQTAARNVSRSPSAEKPAQLVAHWEATGEPFVRMPVEPATPKEIARVHDPAYVRDILAGERDNGFENRLPEVAASLPWTVGSMRSAALYAARECRIACSPTSGFHHARYNQAMGFCTFNGLMVAVRAAWDAGVGRVGILDLDAHYGNGTVDIIRRLRRDDPSLADRFRHYTFGGEGVGRHRESPAAWLDRLPDIVRREFADCDLLLYQAGADPFLDDPYGGFLTIEQLAERDRIVFTEGPPAIAWNLAGGYADLPTILTIHTNTLHAALARTPADDQGRKTEPGA